MLLSLNEREYEIFQKFGTYKKLSEVNPKYKKFLITLISYGLLEFEDFVFDKKFKEKKVYDLSLKKHNSSTPLYEAPVLAHLAITNKCNMQCVYCSVRELHKKSEQKEISTKQWKKIISHLADWGVFQIGFTGGEPTLRKDLAELAKHVTKNGCVFNLTTNGWFLNKKLVTELVKSGMKQCQISLDSHIPQIHDKLRGFGSYERVIKSINILKKSGVAVGIDCVVSKNNISTLTNFIKWIGDMKIKYLTLIKIKKGALSDREYQRLSPSYLEYSNLIKYVCSRKFNDMPNITLDCGSVSNLQEVTELKNLNKIPVAGCPIGHHLICISPNGDIFPCASLLEKRFCLGNVLKDDIKDIWKNNKLLKEFRLIKKKVNGKCKNCERLDICRAGCRGISYHMTKKLFDSDPTCEFSINKKNKFMEVKNENKS